jgi:succinate-semialdehyde dehydrogenase/glutarate-semialdehyde dehydrogenase
MKYSTINPANEEILQEYTEHKASEIESKITKADSEFRKWRNVNITERSSLMLKLSELLIARKETLALIMSREMGKPIAAGMAEIEKSAWVSEYYACEIESMLSNINIETGRRKSYVSFEPLGVLLAIMPWNFPFWQVFRYIAPNLMAGNAVILKHAPNVTECSLAIENLIREAGFPDNLFSSILLAPQSVPEAVKLMIENRLIKGVTLTGSCKAGSYIAEITGRNLKKSVLELGGSDAYIILNDAELSKAAQSCAISRMSNAGQTCIAAKRFIVSEESHDEFIRLFAVECKKFKPGDPLLKETTMGPMARKDLQKLVHEQVNSSIAEGARLLSGGVFPDSPGCFYPPTILTEVSRNSVSFREEIFGPVASVITFKTEHEAIELANATNFGLGSAVFTSDIEKGEYIASKMLDSGSCFVNEFVKSDPRLPFGGIKDSGYGRELTKFGLTEFMNIKTIVVS